MKTISRHTEIDTRNLTMINGDYCGRKITRVPSRYLRWMVRVTHSQVDIAKAELQRRGTPLPAFEVTGHAINRASTNLYRKFYRKLRIDQHEGIFSWLNRMAEEALVNGKRHDQDKIDYAGMRFVFDFENQGEWPVLLTIMPSKRKPK